MEMDYYCFHVRAESEGTPEAITVSKTYDLPEGNFGITEYIWGDIRLWFVDADEFTADERQQALAIYVRWRERARENTKARGGRKHDTRSAC
jgi:hypothetical protein